MVDAVRALHPALLLQRRLFNEIGLEGAPETWTGFAEIAPQLVQKDGDTVTRSAFAHAAGASYIAWLFQGVTWAFGGAYSDPDFTIRINEEGAVNAGEFFRKSVSDGWATTPDDHETDFTNGLTASTMASTGSLGGISASSQVNFRTAFLPKETGPGCAPAGPVWRFWRTSRPRSRRRRSSTLST